MRIRLIAAVWLACSLTTAGSSATDATAQKYSPGIHSLVTQTYIHGIPYELARAQGSASLPELLTMLSDPELNAHHENVMAIIGLIGDEAAVEPLIRYVRDLNGEVSVQTFRTVLIAFQSLGHLAQTGNRPALDFLIPWTNDAHWETARLSFSYRVYRDKALGEVLGRLAIQALGISGRPEAFRILRDMNGSSLREDWTDNVEEAMELNGRVAVEGAASVFTEVVK